MYHYACNISTISLSKGANKVEEDGLQRPQGEFIENTFKRRSTDNTWIERSPRRILMRSLVEYLFGRVLYNTQRL